MSNKGMPHVSLIRADMRRERAETPKLRVQYLLNPSLSALTGTRIAPGRGAKRYVGNIQPLILGGSVTDLATDVLVAVRRDAGGAGHIIAATVRPLTLGTAQGFLAAAQRSGATELHVHRFCKTADEARAAAADLAPADVQALQVA